MKWFPCAMATVLAAVMAGCSTSDAPNAAAPASLDTSDSLNAAYMKPEMMARGIIFILPGIQGVDYHYKNIRSGLRGSGIQCAIMIHPWGCRIPGIGLAINESDTSADREWGRRIAQDILAYQRQYPGRPVYLVGQSGGCAVSVFAGEVLADAAAPALEGIVLLDASLSADYDMSKALGQCRKGIANFYNLSDVALLEVGTAIFGNLDGSRGDSAGRTGFSDPPARLYQVKVTQDMVSRFAMPHFADTSAAFTSRYIAPWIIDTAWPVPQAAGQ